MVASLVSVLGLSAILVSRINRQSHESLTDSTAAGLHAQSALRLGLLKIEEDPNWRFNRSGSDWAVDIPIGNGTYSLQAVDPSDNDISDAPADPIVLIGTGRQGQAVRRTQITLAPLYRGYDCLEAGIHAADDVKLKDAYANVDGLISANDDVRSDSTWLTADVEAVDVISLSHVSGTTDDNADPRTVPDRDTVLQFYLDNGTVIDGDSLPKQFPGILRNGSFEDGDREWAAKGCTIGPESTVVASGTTALAVTGRDDKTDGVVQDITSLLLSGRSMYFSASVGSKDPSAKFYAHVVVSSTDQTQEFTLGAFDAEDGRTWIQIDGFLTPWWTGTLTSAVLVIDTSPSALYGAFYSDSDAYIGDFYVDEVALRETTRVRNIDQALLSPTSNPFGETNPDGIYILDMNGKRVVIRNTRICGTLVLIDPDTTSEIGDGCPIVMSPANAALPALIVADASVYINPSDRGLSESALDLNLNPPGTAHKTIGSDDELDDVFASGIDGLIYSTDNILFRNANTINGCVISAKDVNIKGRLSMTYDSQYYRNPPPGFNGPEQIRILLGSARRTVDP